MAVLAVTALLPATGSAKTYRVSFQLVQFTPTRVWQETAFIPDAITDSILRFFRYPLGANAYRGTWFPAAISRRTASEALGTIYKNALERYAVRQDGAIIDRPLTALEQTRFKTLADLYRDADVLVVAAGHPACAGLTRAQARSIATGGITSWSQVVAGATSDAIKVRYLTDRFDNGVPHLGTKWVGNGTNNHVNYAAGAVGSPDGGVPAAAAGDQAVAAITTWSRIRNRTAGLCVVPLDGVAPDDATVAGLQYPEAFPVSYVVTRKLVGRNAVDRGIAVVMRRAMKAHMASERLKGMLRAQGVLVVGDPLPASPGA
jgi:hypothetical protein